MSLNELTKLLEKDELTSTELCIVISEYLYDTGETHYRLSQASIMSKYNTIKKLIAKYLDVKCYYMGSGRVHIQNTIENKQTKDFRDYCVYFNRYGDVFFYYRGLFHPLKTETNHISYNHPQRYSDFL